MFSKTNSWIVIRCIRSKLKGQQTKTKMLKISKHLISLITDYNELVANILSWNTKNLNFRYYFISSLRSFFLSCFVLCRGRLYLKDELQNLQKLQGYILYIYTIHFRGIYFTYILYTSGVYIIHIYYTLQGYIYILQYYIYYTL